MKKILKPIAAFSFILFFPTFVFAQFVGPCPEGTYNNGTGCAPSTQQSTAQSTEKGLVPCGTTANPGSCGFGDLVDLVNNCINFILYFLAIPIAAIMFAYAGFEMVTAGGDSPEARKKAKSIFFNAVIGLVIVAAAWLIVKTLLSILGWSGAWVGF